MKPINSPRRRSQVKKPNPVKRFFSSNYLNIILTAVLCLIVGFFMLNRTNKSSEDNAENKSYERDTSLDSKTNSKVPSRHKGVVPKRSSTRQEKMNTTDDEASPEFVKEHMKTLTKVMDTQITGGELTLQHETDPRKIAEIKRRIEGAKRMRDKLKTVDPENPDTWFFMKNRKRDDEKIENDWLPSDQNK